MLNEETYLMKIKAAPLRSVAVLCCVGTLSIVCAAATAQDHRAVNLSTAKTLPFSDGVIAGDTLYIAGQEGTDTFGKLVPGGIAPQTKAAVQNIERIAKAAGFDLKDIVSVTVYLADIHEFPDMNSVYRDLFPDPKPARATIQAAALVNNARIEIAAIAVRRH